MLYQTPTVIRHGQATLGNLSSPQDVTLSPAVNGAVAHIRLNHFGYLEDAAGGLCSYAWRAALASDGTKLTVTDSYGGSTAANSVLSYSVVESLGRKIRTLRGVESFTSAAAVVTRNISLPPGVGDITKALADVQFDGIYYSAGTNAANPYCRAARWAFNGPNQLDLWAHLAGTGSGTWYFPWEISVYE